MKIRTVRYIVKEGILNTYKNKLMSLASISIVAAALMIFGIFLLFTVNLSYNAKMLTQQPELQIYCEYELDDAQVKQVEEAILKNPEISECKTVTSKEAFESFKQRLEEDAYVLEGYDDSLLSVSFITKLKDPGKSAAVVGELKKIAGVRKISYSQDLNDFISKFSNWINIICTTLICILLVFSVSILANTIKLTVFARSKEISIMKYIGAADWFIRWPFIVEGVAIGLIGAVAAYMITKTGYAAVENKFNNDLASLSLNLVRIIKTNELKSLLILCYAILGGIVGAVGSLISVRKYLHV